MAKVLIFGISGMDGSNLTDLMLREGHEVFGMIRRHSVAENQQYRLELVKDKIHVEYGDVTDIYSIRRLMDIAQPDYIFNLSAMSHVRISFDIPQYTQQVNYIGNQNILECYRTMFPRAKFYFAGSSEMFGLSLDPDGYQRETTPFNPTSPYGISKVASVNLVRHYRRTYGLFACVGILFNHSGFRRGSNFVCQKIVKTAVEIKLGLTNVLKLGNMDSYRDIGNSKDYVCAMYAILNHVKADDFVIATGYTHSIREICDYVFSYLGLDYEDYVIQDPKLLRPEELPYLRGDSTRARLILGWKPEFTFEQTMEEMIQYWYDYYLTK